MCGRCYGNKLVLLRRQKKHHVRCHGVKKVPYALSETQRDTINICKQ